MKKTKKNGPDGFRKRIYAIASDVTDQVAAIVAGGIADSGMKLRDLTGALKDLEDVLDVRSEEDATERSVRLEKLRRDLGREESGELTVRFEGEAGTWAE